MNTWKVIFATVVIFVAGVLTGSLMVRFKQAHSAKNSEPVHTASLQSTNANREFKLPPPLMGPLRKDFVDRLQKELQINATQRERIEKIICDGQEQTRIIWEEISPDMHQTIIDTKDKIRAELTPDQRAKFEELFKPKPRPVAKPDQSTNSLLQLMTNAPSAR